MTNYLKISAAFVFILLLTSSLTTFGQSSKGTYYILALDGVELKSSSHSRSKVLRRISYGSKVELMAYPSTINLEVNRIQGGMAEVKYNGQAGYVFDGYLSRFPAPKKSDFITYARKLRKLKHKFYYLNHREDWGKYYNSEYEFTLKGDKWVEAFLIAQQLFKIPANYYVPRPYDKPRLEQQYDNPQKPDDVATDRLSLKYDADGFMEYIDYEFKKEGELHKVHLSYEAENNLIRIKEKRVVEEPEKK